MERACESCGNPDDELVLVRRVYLEPSDPDTTPRQVEPSTELWCLSCTSQYPHQPADGE
ncbi:MAG: hypothetical protein ACRDY7_04245 [Acidimicrobiia bacterium]